MSEYQYKEPRIRADRLMPIIIKAMKEYRIIDQTTDLVTPSDLVSQDEYDTFMFELSPFLTEVYEDLHYDRIKGDAGLARIEAFFQRHRRTVDNLFDTRKFPELQNLDEV